METKKIFVNPGRSTGMKALRKRGAEIEKLAAEKKVVIGWENKGSYHLLYINTLAGETVWSKEFLTKGIAIVKKINAFYDVIEEVLKNDSF